MAYDDIGCVAPVCCQRGAAHVLYEAQARRSLLSDLRVFYGGQFRAGQLVSVVFHAFSGVLEKGQRILLLNF